MLLRVLIVSFFNQWIDRLLLIIIATAFPASASNNTHFKLTNMLAITGITYNKHALISTSFSSVTPLPT
jgi:hypothetical protein